MSCFRKYEPKDYSRSNGSFWVLFGLFIGCGMMLAILTNLINTYLKENNSMGSLLFLTYFGIICCIFATAVLVCYYRFTCRCDVGKGILCFFYGLNFGLFSVLYGLIIGCIIFIFCIYSCCTAKTANKKTVIIIEV